MLHKVIEMETFSLIQGTGACLLDLSWVGKANLSLVVILSELVVLSCELGGNFCSCKDLLLGQGCCRGWFCC